MATLAQIYAADFVAGRDDGLPVTVVLGAQSKTGSFTDLRTGLEETDMGYNSQAAAELTILLADWSPPPANNDTVTINGVDYRVKGNSVSVDTVTAVLTLDNVT